MNTKNNLRSQNTKKKIYDALMYLLKHKDFDHIYVKDICNVACINRSSFYEHYQDINDLMIQTEQFLSKNMAEIFKNPPYYTTDTFVKMFEFIKNNKEFYNSYFINNDCSFMPKNDFSLFFDKTKQTIAKIEYPENELVYHMAFFAAGINAMCKAWLSTGLKETPEQMSEILFREYKNKVKFFS